MYEKALEKYHTSMSKYGAVRSAKDATFAREVFALICFILLWFPHKDSFQLYESRQGYFRVLFEYVHRINRFKQTVDGAIIEKVKEFGI